MRLHDTGNHGKAASAALAQRSGQMRRRYASLYCFCAAVGNVVASKVPPHENFALDLQDWIKHKHQRDVLILCPARSERVMQQA